MSEHQGRIAQILRESLRDVGRHLGRDVEQKLARDLHAELHPVIETVEQLDALPDDSCVLVDGVAARKHMGDWYFANDDGDGYRSRSLALYLPARVLYTPEADRG